MTLPPADSYKCIVTWFHKDSDPVTVKEKDSVEHLASVSLDLDAFDYFVEAVQT